MRIFATRPADATDQEINDIIVFKRTTLQLYLQVGNTYILLVLYDLREVLYICLLRDVFLP